MYSKNNKKMNDQNNLKKLINMGLKNSTLEQRQY